MYVVDADRGVLDGVHIGATCRIRLTCLCAVVIRPSANLLLLLKYDNALMFLHGVLCIQWTAATK